MPGDPGPLKPSRSPDRPPDAREAQPGHARRIGRAGLAALDAAAAAGTAALLAVVAGAILGRLLFDLTGGAVDLMVPGAIELSRFALMVMVVSALPGAAARGLLRVDLVVRHLPGGLERGLDRLWGTALAALAGTTGWLLADNAAAQAARGDATQDLQMPLWSFTGYAALCFVALAAVGVAQALGCVMAPAEDDAALPPDRPPAP